MNWLDIVLLVLIAGSILLSVRKGFSRELVGLISVIVALFCGLWFYGSAGSFLLPYVSSKDVANFCGFILIFCGILIAGALIGILLSRLLKVAGLTWFDRQPRLSAIESLDHALSRRRRERRPYLAG